jgi:hypothetical protein
MGRAR